MPASDQAFLAGIATGDRFIFALTRAITTHAVRGTAAAGAPTARAQVRHIPARHVRGDAAAGGPIATARLMVEPVHSVRGMAAAGAPVARARVAVRTLQSIRDIAEARARIDARSLTGQDEIFALEVFHDALTEPVRIVADTADHTVEGNTYVSCPFSAEVPQNKEGEVRRAVLRVDNIGEKLMEWITLSDGGRGATVRIMSLIPAIAQGFESTVSYDVTMAVAVSEVTNELVTVSLTNEPVIGRPSVLLRHDPVTSPGLF